MLIKKATKTIIIGGGLSGVLTAYRLYQKGQEAIILEASDRLGGRIKTIHSENGTPLEMGATWFTSQHLQLIQLIRELGLKGFKQFSKGPLFFQATPTTPPQKFELPPQDPSYRIAGGTAQLIKKISQQLPIENILLNEKVESIDFTNDEVCIVKTKQYEFTCQKVVSSLPPALFTQSITLLPSLKSDIKALFADTHTWMHDAIKVGITYQKAFWKTNNMSGMFFSNNGPIAELHDHCNAKENRFALVGFIHPSFQDFSKDEREKVVIKQLQSAYGEEAKHYLQYNENLWLDNELTSDGQYQDLVPHQNNGDVLLQTPLFNNRLFIVSTESSPHFGGYLEGAVYRANTVAEEVL
ncbi:flavin monoamine oxidase family protein [Flammeovirga kamogawensis]|uniref:FAD-dependent oxidoreductase n=1 Tax=Flammeovirga kamogawensis TaxID=373891 RepID=A0ABX8GQU5_9BACT|nr:FAD-dependent oxidoreductase [Flammeovirga kamogawensis]MBB6463487.1 monoamine oxidase [Flammeovirga kamogawensis]QWG05587.1 FAD-dependent oxidoreductase [Flammeovirga kamogawensis]